MTTDPRRCARALSSTPDRAAWTLAVAGALAAGLTCALAMGGAARVAAQEASADTEDAAAEETAPEEAAPAAPPTALPPPTLEEEEPIAPAEPQPAPEPEQPVILHRIGTGDHPEWEDEGELPRDIAFETPGDQRVATNQQAPAPQAQLPAAAPDVAPRTFELGVAGGYARLLAAEAIDLVRVEERFEARLPELEVLRLGVGATQMFSDTRFFVGGGVRIGFGAFFCEAGWVQCEGVATVQPGVLYGDILGVRFDLNASLDLRFLIEHLVELSIGGGYSLLGELSLLHVTGQVGFVF